MATTSCITVQNKFQACTPNNYYYLVSHETDNSLYCVKELPSKTVAHMRYEVSACLMHSRCSIYTCMLQRI